MSLSLSSLLNPEGPAQPPPAQSSPPARRESLPSIQYVQSPEQHHVHLPPTSPQQQRHYGSPPINQGAAQSLPALQSSNVGPPTSYYGHPTPGYAADGQRSSSERRLGSGHGAPIELPPPSADSRGMSSPTLEHYHVASRSPEQRRPSMISPEQAGFSLPPIQGLNAVRQEPAYNAREHEPVNGESHAANTFSLPDRQTPLAKTEAHESVPLRKESTTSQLPHYSPPAPLKPTFSNHIPQADGPSSSPAHIKQEALATPEATSSPITMRQESSQLHEPETSTTLKAVASLKNEHGLRTHSPLRDSSAPLPTTETPPSEHVSIPRKRPAPSKKKGTATATKKAPPSKKRKIDPSGTSKRSATPSSSRASKSLLKTGSSKGNTPANSSPARSPSVSGDEPYGDEDEDEEGDVDMDGENDGDVYCICRKPDNGTFMIGCDGTCDDWFHGKCVGIEERDKNLIDKYICPYCAGKPNAGRTTWKRMCRRQGCRQPARVGKAAAAAKDGKGHSKYCSEECGVLFFRDMVARTRGKEELGRDRSSRKRKSSFVERTGSGAMSDDIGARGGVLAAGEVKGLVREAKTADDFRRLGEGVLSPPATPDGKTNKHNGSKPSSSSPTDANKKDSTTTPFTPAETQHLESVASQKDAARRRHQVLKDRMKFVTLVKQAAARAAAEREVKGKEYCGYDPRLEWTEEQFVAWRESAIGKQAFGSDTLAVEDAGTANKSTDEGAMDVDVDPADVMEAQLEVCARKKCPRHLEWGKLVVDDLRFEMGDNSDRMRGLDREEREVRERAKLRGLMGDGEGKVGGSVEVHGLGIGVEGKVEWEGGEKMDVDVDGEKEVHDKMDVDGDGPEPVLAPAAAAA